jgi:hypothetical protein
MKLDLVVMVCRLTVMIRSEICTNRPSFSFLVNEISRTKVAILEGAAGLSIINQIISVS